MMHNELFEVQGELGPRIVLRGMCQSGGKPALSEWAHGQRPIQMRACREQR